MILPPDAQNAPPNLVRRTELSTVQRFVKACNEEITKAGFQATIGGTALMYQCTKGVGCVGDWWADAGLSFRTVHYYGWMIEEGQQADPFSTKPSDWGLPDG